MREGIDYHDRLYYVENNPVISDAVYDKLFARLQELEEAFPELASADSPTRRVGAPPAESLGRVEHTVPMLSLEAALDEKEVREFFDFLRRETGRERFAWVAEPKFDGVSVELVYEGGIFRRGATRGDGRIGEEVTANLATVRTLPLRLGGEDPPPFLAVRGEVYLPKQAFQELNRKRLENGEEPFANPRNACAGPCAGWTRRSSPTGPSTIFFYEILRVEGTTFASHWEILKTLQDWGLRTDPVNRRVAGFEEIADYREELVEKREELPYEIDGIVVKLDDLTLRESLGTRHRSPAGRWPGSSSRSRR